MIDVAVIKLLTHVSNIFSARSFLRVALKNNCRFICYTVSGLNDKIKTKPSVLVDKLDNVHL